jgi:putative membrane protein
MSMRSLMASAAGGMVLALSAGLDPLQAQGSQAEQQFVSQVAAENLMEVRLSQAAQQKAVNPSVKQFAQRMIIDHTAMQKQWMDAAKKNGLEFKAEMTSRHQQQAEQLKSAAGAAFDQTYMGLMVQNHQENLSTFQAQRNAAHSADVRQLIETALPTLQEHLSTAQQINGQVGGSVATNTGGQTPTQPGQTPTTPPVGQTATTPPVGQTQPAQVQNVRADSAFVGEVNASNEAELRLARLAQSRGSADVVKRFAQKMETDHNSMQKEWAAVAANSGIRIAAAANPGLQEDMSRLQRLSGTSFDRAYMAMMVENHRETLTKLQAARRTTKSTEVGQLLARSLPLVQEHLTLAQQISAQVGSDNTIATIEDNADRGKKGNIREDREFIKDVYADHKFEIGLGRLAQERARDESVKKFGRRMVNDHTRLQQYWVAMISNQGMDYESGMGRRHREKIYQLERLSGRQFDRAYMTTVAQNHREYLDLFRKEARRANSAAVRGRVTRAIPMLEEHFQLAKQIGARVGADTSTVKNDRISATQR